jgi:CheY-like chemotaxis protein
VLDLLLPDMPGWSVLSELKRDAATRHIPVQVLSTQEDGFQHRPRGAYGLVSKPGEPADLQAALVRLREYAAPRRKRLLIVEDDPAEQLGLTELLGHAAVEIAVAGTGQAALEALRSAAFDCVVLDLNLPDIGGFEILEHIRDDPALHDPPVVVFTGKDLSPQEDERLHQLARGVVVKDVRSPERLLDETALLLHLAAEQIPQEKRRLIQELRESDEDLVGKLVLIVDDDVRNIFALSGVLEEHGMRTISANTGAHAIAQIESTPNVAIVLMDIMMPEMDGYQTMRTVRQNPAHRSLPIIALTANAMKGDREKCLEAGASDYLAKPVDTEQLLAALRLWMHR